VKAGLRILRLETQFLGAVKVIRELGEQIKACIMTSNDDIIYAYEDNCGVG